VSIETKELTHFLNELLEAERAGARVTLVWAAIPRGKWAHFMGKQWQLPIRGSAWRS
jgi:hypothetical protein